MVLPWKTGSRVWARGGGERRLGSVSHTCLVTVARKQHSPRTAAAPPLARRGAAQVWHFYLGGPMTVVELGGPGAEPGGGARTTTLGSDVLSSAPMVVQHVVRAGASPFPVRRFAAAPPDVARRAWSLSLSLSGGASATLTRVQAGSARTRVLFTAW